MSPQSPCRLCKLFFFGHSMCDVWMEWLYQHVARHRYPASGSQPGPSLSLSLFFFLLCCLPQSWKRLPSISRLINAAARSASSLMSSTLCSLDCIKIYAWISSSKHDIRGRLLSLEAYGCIQGDKRCLFNWLSTEMHPFFYNPYA